MEAEVAHITEKMNNEKKQYLLLKLKLEEKGKRKLTKQKSLTKGVMDELTKKMKIARDISDYLTRALIHARQEADFKEKSAALKLKALETKDKELQDKIQEERNTLKEKVKEVNQMKLEARKAAEALQKELEKKAQEKLKKERNEMEDKLADLKGQLATSSQRQKTLMEALEQEKDEKVKAALAKQLKEERAKQEAITKKVSLFSEKLNSVKLELSLRKKAITAQQQEQAMKKMMSIKKGKKELERSQKDWQHEEAEELKEALKKIHDEYYTKIKALKEQLEKAKKEMNVYKETIAKDYENEINDELDKGKLKYEDIVAKIKAKLNKKENDFEKYKTDSANDYAKLEAEEKEKLASESNATIQSTERLVKLEVSKEKAAFKAAQAVLAQKLEKEKAAIRQKIMGIKSDIAALKSDVLVSEAKVKAKLSLAMTNRMGMKTEYENEVADTKQKKKEAEAKKKEIGISNKMALDKQSKEDSKQIETTMNKLEKLKIEGMKAEADLEAKINAAKEESKALKETLDTEKENYAAYNDGVKEWKTKQTLKHKESVAVEKSKYKEIEADYKEQAKSCEAEIKAAKKSIKVLKDKLAAELKSIKGINLTKEARTVAKGKIGDLQKDAGKKAGELATLKATRRQLCESGTPGQDIKAQCATMKTEIAAAEKVIVKINADIAKAEKAFSTF